MTETRTVEIPINGDFQAEIDKLVAEGWEIEPGTMPVAIYRLRKRHSYGLEANLYIDDSKVMILRDGKLIPQ